MPRRLPPLNALRAFEAAGRHGSFSEAGLELNVSHSSISRHVRGLERRLGVQLFKNMPRGVKITEAGCRYLETTSAAFDEIAEATEILSGHTEDSISISSEPTFTLKWLMPALGKFHALHPGVDIDIDAGFELADLHRHECDLAIRFCSQDVVGLESDLISKSPVFPVGAPDLMGKKLRNFDAKELLKFRLLVENHGELWRQWFEMAGMPDVKLPNKPSKLKTMLAIEAAIAGQGIALVSMELVANDIKAGKLVCFSDIGLDYGAYKLVYQKATMRRRSVQIFRDWLLNESAGLRL